MRTNMGQALFSRWERAAILPALVCLFVFLAITSQTALHHSAVRQLPSTSVLWGTDGRSGPSRCRRSWNVAGHTLSPSLCASLLPRTLNYHPPCVGLPGCVVFQDERGSGGGRAGRVGNSPSALLSDGLSPSEKLTSRLCTRLLRRPKKRCCVIN